ncbi:MAG: hypothetical protein Q4D56_08040 [Bacteroides sp.]|nr:hypothetical protein [Bacteroides sp.]
MKRIKLIILLLLCSWCCPSFGAVMGEAAGLTDGATSAMAVNVAAHKQKKKKKARKKKQKKQKEQDVPQAPVLSEEQQRKYDYYYLEAIRLKMQNEYDAAFELLQHCLEINPCASSALYELAQYYAYLKQQSQGLDALEKAVRYAPDNYWYSQALAGMYQQQNQPDKAIALLEDMTTRFPLKLDPLYTLLDIYHRQADYDQVLGTLNRLEQKTGKSEQISMEKFRIYLQKKDDKQAFNEIESLVAEYPQDLRYQVILGDVYLQNGKQNEAYTMYRKVLDEEPDNAMAMYSLASYYEETGQKELYDRQLDSLLLNRKVEPATKLTVMRQLIVQNEQAGGDSIRIINLFDRILEQDPEEADLPMLYAQYLLSKGMNQESLPVLRVVLNIDPTNTAARMMLLGDAIRKEDYKGVISLCEAGVESNPDMLEFYFYLAIGYNQAGRTDDALTISQKALTHVTKDSKPEVISDFYTIIGDSYHSKNMNAEAYAAYDSSLVYNPDNYGALNNYAYYLSLERQHLDKAEEMSYKTIKAEPNNATYLDTYAWILFEKGNYAEARIYIDDAMKNDGAKSADVVEHCGDIYYMTGDVAGALTYWKQAQAMGSESTTLKEKIARKKFVRGKK